MNYVLNALLPICFIIFTGYAFKHAKFPSVDFWPKMDKFTYYVLMPCLLVYELAVAKIDLTHTVNLVFSSLSGIFIILVILILLNMILHFENRAFTSIVQGGIRFNTYVFLALVNAVYSDKGLVLAAIVMASAIPCTLFSISLAGTYFLKERSPICTISFSDFMLTLYRIYQ